MRPAPTSKIQLVKNQVVHSQGQAQAQIRTPSPGETQKVAIKSLFKSRGYCFLTAGLFLACLGVFFPSFYLQVCLVSLSWGEEGS